MPFSRPVASFLADMAEGRAVAATGQIKVTRLFGKAFFGLLDDGTGRLPIFCKEDTLPGYAAIADGGCFTVEGTVIQKTNGEMVVYVKAARAAVPDRQFN